MNIQIKTSLILLITLLIGLMLGALVSGVLRQHHFERRIEKWRTPEGFVHRWESIIQPDESQRRTVRDVLERHSELFSEIHIDFHEKFSASIDSLKSDLDRILTEEQRRRLNRRDHFERRRPLDRRDHFEERSPRGRRKHFPGKDAPPGSEPPGEHGE